MTNILDFTAYKNNKQLSDKLEESYLSFLSNVNKLVGVPSSVEDCAKVFYFIMRYFEGTLNCLSVLSLLKLKTDPKMSYELKQHLITWLEGILNDLKNS